MTYGYLYAGQWSDRKTEVVLLTIVTDRFGDDSHGLRILMSQQGEESGE